MTLEPVPKRTAFSEAQIGDRGDRRRALGVLGPDRKWTDRTGGQKKKLNKKKKKGRTGAKTEKRVKDSKK